jgi:hypothetical protein
MMQEPTDKQPRIVEEGPYVSIAGVKTIDRSTITGFQRYLNDGQKQVTIFYADTRAMTFSADKADELIRGQTGKSIEDLAEKK